MSQEQILGALRLAITEKHSVHIERNTPTKDDWNGYPVALSNNFVLIRAIVDFSFDGFVILPLKDILSARCGERESFRDHVMRQEGTLKVLSEVPAVRLNSWRTILEDVKKNYQHAIIECEDEEEECNFFIGPILGIAEKKVALRYFQVEGILEREATFVSLRTITALRFDQHYIRSFAKYSREERL
jgi:hypothetical protein